MNKKLMMALTAFLLTFTAQGQTMRSLWIAMLTVSSLISTAMPKRSWLME